MMACQRWPTSCRNSQRTLSSRGRGAGTWTANAPSQDFRAALFAANGGPPAGPRPSISFDLAAPGAASGPPRLAPLPGIRPPVPPAEPFPVPSGKNGSHQNGTGAAEAAAVTSNKSAAQALRDRLKALVGGKRAAEGTSAAAGDDSAGQPASGTEGTNGHQTPVKRTKMDTSPPADSMDGVERAAEMKQEVKQEASDGAQAAEANGRAGSAAEAGRPADVAAFWAQLAGDAGGKTAAADVKPGDGNAAEPAAMDVQPPQGSKAAEAGQTAAVKTDGVADGARQGVDANGDAAMDEEQAVTADGTGEVAAEDEEEVTICCLPCKGMHACLRESS